MEQVSVGDRTQVRCGISEQKEQNGKESDTCSMAFRSGVVRNLSGFPTFGKQSHHPNGLKGNSAKRDTKFPETVNGAERSLPPTHLKSLASLPVKGLSPFQSKRSANPSPRHVATPSSR